MQKINKMTTKMFLLLALMVTSLEAVTQTTGSSITESDTQSGLEIMLSQYDWESMWKEMSISGDIVFCKPKTTKDGLVGVKATLSEPLYLVDVTTEKGKVESLGIEITKSQPEKAGTATNGGGIYLHIFRFNVMDLLLGDTGDGVLAWEKGSPSITYLGELDPKKWDDSMASLLAPERTMYSNVVAVLASAASCQANTTLEYMPYSQIRTGKAGVYTRSLIDSMYYNVGCSGSVAIGTTVTSSVTFSTAMLTTVSVFSDMHSGKGVVASLKVKHSVQSTLNGYDEDIFCHPVSSLTIPLTMYSIQLLYPTVSGTHEWGVNPAEYAYKGKGGRDHIKMMFIVNQRRDYAAMAYSF